MNMDWSKILEYQQKDFISRLSLKEAELSSLENTDVSGIFSEIIYVSGALLNECIDYAVNQLNKIQVIKSKSSIFEKEVRARTEDFKRKLRNEFLGKLGEVALKKYLGNLVSDVNFRILKGGDGGFDFYLNSKSSARIQVKTRYVKNVREINKISWFFNLNEIEKSSVLVCLFTTDEIDPFRIRDKYKINFAGFKPTGFLKELSQANFSLALEDFLYAGGLKAYLECISNVDSDSIQNKIDSLFLKSATQIRVGKHNEAIININQALRLVLQEKSIPTETKNNQLYSYNYDLDLYELFKSQPRSGLLTMRGFCYSQIGNYEKSIQDFTESIEINPDSPLPYFLRANASFKNTLPRYEKTLESFVSRFMESSCLDLSSIALNLYSNNSIEDYFLFVESLTKKIINTDVSSNINSIESIFRDFFEEDKILVKCGYDYNRAIELNSNAYLYYLYRATISNLLLNHKLLRNLLRGAMLNYVKQQKQNLSELENSRIADQLISQFNSVREECLNLYSSMRSDIKESMKLAHEASDLSTYRKALLMHAFLEGEKNNLQFLSNTDLSFFYDLLGDDLPF